MQGTLVIMFQAAEAPKGGHSHSGEEGPQGRMETVQAAGVGRLQGLWPRDQDGDGAGCRGGVAAEPQGSGPV